jgi:hypothetical protein
VQFSRFLRENLSLTISIPSAAQKSGENLLSAHTSFKAPKADVRFLRFEEARPTTDMVKVFGCRPATIERLGMGRRTETAHARTRGDARSFYGDLGVVGRR